MHILKIKKNKNSKNKKKKYKKRNWNEYLLENNFKENNNIKIFKEEDNKSNKENNRENINEEKTKNVEVQPDDNKEKDIIEYILDPNENTKEYNLKALNSEE